MGVWLIELSFRYSARLDLGIEESSLTGNVDWQYSDGLIFVKFDF